jgi:V/A-type H+-transporting ATPase subunit A
MAKYFDGNVNKDFSRLRKEFMELLQKEAELKEIVQLVGPDALPEEDRLIIETAKSIREDFLQQNAFHEVDAHCSLDKQFSMMKAILDFHRKCGESIKAGVKISKLVDMPVREKIARMKESKDIDKAVRSIEGDVDSQLKELNTGVKGE